MKTAIQEMSTMDLIILRKETIEAYRKDKDKSNLEFVKEIDNELKNRERKN
jgi:hypothetical protein